MKFLFIAMNNMGELTGGDTIWINLLKYWLVNGHEVSGVYTRIALDTIEGKYNPIKPTIANILKNIIIRTYQGIKQINEREYDKIKIPNGFKYVKPRNFDYVYSVSDFYPDLIPALIYKLKHPKTRWIAGYYLVSLMPFAQNSPYKGFNWLKGVLYYLMQIPSRIAVNLWADIVFVTSEPDRKYFPRKKVVVVRGGVSKTGERYEKSKYDAIFIGRFHYQKGVIELLDIWADVVKALPSAKLCMIGDGPLMNECLRKRFKLGIESNVDFVGFKNGEEKYELIKSSKIVVHPATFDSGGMACAEAMAFGLPAVGFDLPAYKTYYPKGFLKVKNNWEFSEFIIMLLENPGVYKRFSKQAKDLILEQWIWEKRAKDILDDITI